VFNDIWVHVSSAKMIDFSTLWIFGCERGGD